jgi:2-iminoacetate synthase ThiH
VLIWRREEVEALEAMGHRRLLLLTGEHPKYPLEKFLEAVNVVSTAQLMLSGTRYTGTASSEDILLTVCGRVQVGNVKMNNPCGEIRRINVEIPSLSVSDMKRLKATKYIGTYTLFQETYHRATFKQMHPYGPKSDYDHRLLTMDRAQLGGLDDVGIGALFGLADYRFEVMAMLMHAHHLDRTYGCGPHTISVPRYAQACLWMTSLL